MQGGENFYFKDDDFAAFVKDICTSYPDLAITLSLGQKPHAVYQKYFDAGAKRFLLRHESADADHFAQLHPAKQTLQSRLDCLADLKSIGFQTGAGFMVGSPHQSSASIASDFTFLQEFQPQMVGIGPYMSHPQTLFAGLPSGDLRHVLACYALARLVVPKALLPSTTATSSLHPSGRSRALHSGCNVIMINLSPVQTRQQYSLYSNKTYKGDESDEYLAIIQKDVEEAGLTMSFAVGHHAGYQPR
jgi:biotin synthase